MTNEAAPSRPTITPEQLKAARELLGWSQMDVANRVGLTEWVIGFFERGERLIRARYLRRVRSMFEAAGVIFRRGERRGAWREAPQGCEMSINPNRSTANIKLFELCEPPQREVKHSAKTAKPEIRRTAMFTKISRPTVEAVIQTDHSKKSYGTPDARDDRPAEPSKGALAKMTEAHMTSLDAIVHGFASAGALHF